MVSSLDHGVLVLQRGLLRITEEERAAAEVRQAAQVVTVKKEPAEADAFSGTLVKELSCERTLAVQAALCTQADIAVALMTWHLARSVFGGSYRHKDPSRVQLNASHSVLCAGSGAGECGKAFRHLMEEKGRWSLRMGYGLAAGVESGGPPRAAWLPVGPVRGRRTGAPLRQHPLPFQQ